MLGIDCRDQLWCRKKSIVATFRCLFIFNSKVAEAQNWHNRYTELHFIYKFCIFDINIEIEEPYLRFQQMLVVEIFYVCNWCVILHLVLSLVGLSINSGRVFIRNRYRYTIISDRWRLEAENPQYTVEDIEAKLAALSK